MIALVSTIELGNSLLNCFSTIYVHFVSIANNTMFWFSNFWPTLCCSAISPLYQYKIIANLKSNEKMCEVTQYNISDFGIITYHLVLLIQRFLHAYSSGIIQLFLINDEIILVVQKLYFTT